jgi:histidine triad (HIT) family protein
MEGCVFCAIAAGKIPSYRVYEDEKFMAFLDIYPANKGHLVIAPKGHFKTIMEMPEQEYSHFFMIARALCLALFEYGAQGVNILHSIGEAAGQRVPHVITHLVPRYTGDKVHLVWDPQKMDENQLKQVQQELMSKIRPEAIRTAAPQPQVIIEEPKPEKKQVYELPPRTGGYW